LFLDFVAVVVSSVLCTSTQLFWFIHYPKACY